MRIRGLHIEGFGRFADLRFGPFERRVTVFHGPNEAGKSTLLEFIRRILFGFPRRSARNNPYPALHGGSYGGSVTVVSDAGREVTIHRTRGTGGGRVVMTEGSGAPLPEAELPILLGHHSRDVFERVFAFTLDELHSEDLLSDDSVNSQMYSAGMGAAALPDALKTLNDQKTGLFLKGGTKHDIAVAAKELGDVESKLDEVKNNAQEYGRLTSELEGVREDLEERNEARQECQSRLARQQRLESAWDHWNELVEAERQLDETPAIENFPVDGVTRLEALDERAGAARREHEAALLNVNQAEARATAPVTNEAVMDYSDGVRELVRGRDSFDGSLDALPQREAELKKHTGDLQQTLRELGPDWNESRLKNFDLSLAVNEEISETRERLRNLAQELTRCEVELAQAKDGQREATEAETYARQRLEEADTPEFDAAEVGRRRSLVRGAESRLQQAKQARDRAADLEGHLRGLGSPEAPAGRGSIGAAGAAAVLGVALMAVGAVLGGPTLPFGMAAGLALLGIAAYLLVSGRASAGAGAEHPMAAPTRESLQRTTDELSKLEAELEQDAASLALDGIDEASLAAAHAALDTAESLLAKRARLSESLEGASRLAAQRKESTERSGQAVEAARTRLEAARNEWREWLRARGLRDTFTPETVIGLRGKVELGLDRLENVRDWRGRITAIQEDIDEYVDAVEPVARVLGIPLTRTSPKTAATAADRLIDLHGEVQETVRERTAAMEDLAKARQELEGRDKDLRNAQEELEALLQSGGASDAGDFRARAAESERRTGLLGKRRASLDHLQRLSGPGQPLEDLKRTLEDTDFQSIRDGTTQAKEELEAVVAGRDELSSESGRIQSELYRLVGEEESSKLRMERKRLVEEIKAHAREWTKRTLATQLLEEARGKFERERQPDVVQHAESFFRQITGGSYETVYSPLDEKSITVTDAFGTRKQPSELSRGTREQLFLSLRFGLVREMGKQTESLPVVVDEVLVNFDSERGRHAARAFIELSETNQVLVFTCHQNIVDLFRDAAAAAGEEDPQVIELAQAGA